MIKRTLYIENQARLYTKNEQLCMDFDDTSKKVPIEDIGILILDNSHISITQFSIFKLLENNVAVLWCDPKHHPLGLLLPLYTNSTFTENLRIQLETSVPLKKQAWKQTVQAKIRNQAALLKLQNKAYEPLMHWALEVNSGDSRNLEARAAHYYWQQLFSGLDDFNRGQFEDPPNNLLNYGYAILRAVVARSLSSTGLICAVGIHHRNKYNPFCLADDIMESYRPFVDRMVIEIMKDRDLNDLTLNKEVKAKLLTIPVLDTMIDEMSSPLMIATQRSTASLLKFFNGETRVLKYPDLWKTAVTLG